MSTPDDVCVVTHPIGSSADSHAETLTRIIGSITSVSLVAVWISDEASLIDEYDITRVSATAMNGNVVQNAVQFILNQFRMALILRRRDESTVLFFGTTAYLLPILVARTSGKRVILEPRGDVPLTLRLQWERRMPDPLAGVLAGLVRLLERAGYLLANDVITYTPSMARELDLDPTSESVHPNGARYVDLDRFYPRTPFEDRDRVVGYLGRLDEEKGIRTLAAVAKHLPEDIRFRFIGDGDLRNWLETELESERAAGQVEVTGWVDHEDVPSELSSLQLLVMASEPTEGLPTTILEAMACGTPAYATSVSGVPDVVKEGETGYLMAEMDPESVAAEIASLLDSDELSSTSANARALITSSYDFDAARDRYEEIFSTLAA